MHFGFFGYLCISLGKYLCKSYAHFNIRLFVFLLLSCKSSLYILDTQSLSGIWLTNDFFECVRCLVAFLIVSFNMHVLMWRSLVYPVFLLLTLLLVPRLRLHHHTHGHKDLNLCSFLEFYSFGSHIKIINPFEGSFDYGMSQESSFVIFACGCPVAPALFIGDTLLFSLNDLVKEQLTINIYMLITILIYDKLHNYKNIFISYLNITGFCPKVFSLVFKKQKGEKLALCIHTNYNKYNYPDWHSASVCGQLSERKCGWYWEGKIWIIYSPVLQEPHHPAGKKSIYCAQLLQNDTEQERMTCFDCGVWKISWSGKWAAWVILGNTETFWWYCFNILKAGHVT